MEPLNISLTTRRTEDSEVAGKVLLRVGSICGRKKSSQRRI